MSVYLATHQATKIVTKQNYFAAIDLGSNSFHILVAEFINDHMQPVHCWGEKTQLADGLDEQENLSAAAKQRAFACLARFAEAIADVPVNRVKVVGTAALRKAADGLEFVKQAEKLLGVPVVIISGEQEAHIIYQAVINGKRERNQAIAETALIIDIGGGSTELVLAKPDKLIACASLPLGCVSYSQRFFPNQSSSSTTFEQALQKLRAELSPIRDVYSSHNWKQGIGTAGTAIAIESVLLAKGWSNGGINREGLVRLADILCHGENVAALHLPGLNEERFDIVTAGVAIMLAIFQVFEIEHLETSSDSLREGLVYSLQLAQ